MDELLEEIAQHLKLSREYRDTLLRRQQALEAALTHVEICLEIEADAGLDGLRKKFKAALKDDGPKP